jgi:hypothetical protein
MMDAVDPAPYWQEVRKEESIFIDCTFVAPQNVDVMHLKPFQ